MKMRICTQTNCAVPFICVCVCGFFRPCRLTALLEKTLQFLGTPELRQIPIAILDRVDSIPTKLVQKVQGIRKVLPVRIKRKIWEGDANQFRDDVYVVLGSNYDIVYGGGGSLPRFQKVTTTTPLLFFPLFPTLSPAFLYFTST